MAPGPCFLKSRLEQFTFLDCTVLVSVVPIDEVMKIQNVGAQSLTHLQEEHLAEVGATIPFAANG